MTQEGTRSMPFSRPFFRLGLALVLMGVPASAPALDFVNPLSIIKGTVEALVEDRSAEDIAKDLEIKAKITAQVIDEMGSDVISISSDVYEQDVMLTGTVETEAEKAKAGAITAAIAGVKTVHNQIMVVKPVDKEKGAVESFVDDTVIETKINGLFLDARGVNVTNFRWRSVGGRVFLFGRALSADEHDKATRIAEGIKNVVSVVNLARIRAKD